jgi:hypothetical protein
MSESCADKSVIKKKTALFPMWLMIQKNGKYDHVDREKVQKCARVLANLFSQPMIDSTSSSLAKDLTEDELQAIKFFQLRRILVSCRKRTMHVAAKTDFQVQPAPKSTSTEGKDVLPLLVPKASTTSATSATRDLSLQIPETSDDYYRRITGIAPGVIMLTTDISSDSSYLELLTPVSTTTTCADVASTLAHVKKGMPARKSLKAKAPRAELNFSEISVHRQGGMSVMDCWRRHVALSGESQPYGKAMFYRLVGEHEKQSA